MSATATGNLATLDFEAMDKNIQLVKDEVSEEVEAEKDAFIEDGLDGSAIEDEGVSLIDEAAEDISGETESEESEDEESEIEDAGDDEEETESEEEEESKPKGSKASRRFQKLANERREAQEQVKQLQTQMQQMKAQFEQNVAQMQTQAQEAQLKSVLDVQRKQLELQQEQWEAQRVAQDRAKLEAMGPFEREEYEKSQLYLNQAKQFANEQTEGLRKEIEAMRQEREAERQEAQRQANIARYNQELDVAIKGFVDELAPEFANEVSDAVGSMILSYAASNSMPIPEAAKAIKQAQDKVLMAQLKSLGKETAKKVKKSQKVSKAPSHAKKTSPAGSEVFDYKKYREDNPHVSSIDMLPWNRGA